MVDLIDHFGISFELAGRIAFSVKVTDEFDSGIQSPKNLAQSRAAFLRTAEQIMSELDGSAFEKFPHERRTINPVAQTRTGAVQAPYQRHAVGREAIVTIGQLA